MYRANVFKIMIGGPSDTEEQVKSAIEQIHRWNGLNYSSEEIILLPMHWKTDSFPSIGKPQSIINEQICEKSDMLVCIFNSRIGNNTDKFISGSVEEIEEHIKSNKPVMVFMSTKININEGLDQVKKLFKFREDYSNKILWTEYENDFSDLFFDKLSRSVINNWGKIANSSDFYYREQFQNIFGRFDFLDDEIQSIRNFIGAGSAVSYNGISELHQCLFERIGEENNISQHKINFLVYKLLAVASKSLLDDSKELCERYINSIFAIIKSDEILYVFPEQYEALSIAFSSVIEGEKLIGWDKICKIIANAQIVYHDGSNNN